MRSRLTIALALTALAVTGCAPALASERADETQGFASVQDVQVQSLDDSTKDAPAAESPAFEPTPEPAHEPAPAPERDENKPAPLFEPAFDPVEREAQRASQRVTHVPKRVYSVLGDTRMQGNAAGESRFVPIETNRSRRLFR